MESTIFLTRSEYDQLIKWQARWVATYWETLKRRWSLDGVVVTGTDKVISELRDLRERGF